MLKQIFKLSCCHLCHISMPVRFMHIIRKLTLLVTLPFLFDVAFDIFFKNLFEGDEVKSEYKANEDVPQQAEQAGDWDAQAKSEDDRYSYSRKRSYDDSRGYGYYEHREERR